MDTCNLSYIENEKMLCVSASTNYTWAIRVDGNIRLRQYYGTLQPNEFIKIPVYSYDIGYMGGLIECRFINEYCQIIKDLAIREHTINFFSIEQTHFYLFGKNTKNYIYIHYGSFDKSNVIEPIYFDFGQIATLVYDGKNFTFTNIINGINAYKIIANSYDEQSRMIVIEIQSLCDYVFADEFSIYGKDNNGNKKTYVINIQQSIVEQRPSLLKVSPLVIHLTSEFPKQKISVTNLINGEVSQYGVSSHTINASNTEFINDTDSYLFGRQITKYNTLNSLQNINITKNASHFLIDMSSNEKNCYGVLDVYNNQNDITQVKWYYTYIENPNDYIKIKKVDNIIAYFDDNGKIHKTNTVDFKNENQHFLTLRYVKENNENLKDGQFSDCIIAVYNPNEGVIFTIDSKPSYWNVFKQSEYTKEVKNGDKLIVSLDEIIPINENENIILENQKGTKCSIKIESEQNIFENQNILFGFKDNNDIVSFKNITFPYSGDTLEIVSFSNTPKITLINTTVFNENLNNNTISLDVIYYKHKDNINNINLLSDEVKDVTIDENYEEYIHPYNFQIKYKQDINRYYVTYGTLHDKKIGNNFEQELMDTNDYFFEGNGKNKLIILQPKKDNEIYWKIINRGNGVKFNVYRYENPNWINVNFDDYTSWGGIMIKNNIDTHMPIDESIFHDKRQLFITEEKNKPSINLRNGDVCLCPIIESLEDEIVETIIFRQFHTFNEITLAVTLSNSEIGNDNSFLKIGDKNDLSSMINCKIGNKNTVSTIVDGESIKSLYYASYIKNDSFHITDIDVNFFIRRYFNKKENNFSIKNLNNKNTILYKILFNNVNYREIIENWYLDNITNELVIEEKDENGAIKYQKYFPHIDSSEDENGYIFYPQDTKNVKNSEFYFYFNPNVIYQIDGVIDYDVIQKNDKKYVNFNCIYQVIPEVVKINNKYYMLDSDSSFYYDDGVRYYSYNENNAKYIALNSVKVNILFNTYDGYYFILNGEKEKLVDFKINYNNISYTPQLFFDIYNKPINILHSFDGDNKNDEKDSYVILGDKKCNKNILNEIVFNTSIKFELQDNIIIPDVSALIKGNIIQKEEYVVINFEKYPIIDNNVIYQNQQYTPIVGSDEKYDYIINNYGYKKRIKEAEQYVLINNQKCKLSQNNIVYQFYEYSNTTEFLNVEHIFNEYFKYNIDINNLYQYDYIQGYDNDNIISYAYIDSNGKYEIIQKEAFFKENVYPYEIEIYEYVNHNISISSTAIIQFRDDTAVEIDNNIETWLSGTSKKLDKNIKKITFLDDSEIYIPQNSELHFIVNSDCIIGYNNKGKPYYKEYKKRETIKVESNTTLYFNSGTEIYLIYDNLKTYIFNDIVYIDNERYFIDYINSQKAIILNKNIYYIYDYNVIINDVVHQCYPKTTFYTTISFEGDTVTKIDLISFGENNASLNKENINNTVYGYIDREDNNTIKIVTDYSKIIWKIYLPTIVNKNKNQSMILGVEEFLIENIDVVQKESVIYNKAIISNYYNYLEGTERNIIIENGKFDINIDEYQIKYDDKYYHINKFNDYKVIIDNIEYSIWDWYSNTYLPQIQLAASCSAITLEQQSYLTLNNVMYKIKENEFIRIDNHYYEIINNQIEYNGIKYDISDNIVTITKELLINEVQNTIFVDFDADSFLTHGFNFYETYNRSGNVRIFQIQNLSNLPMNRTIYIKQIGTNKEGYYDIIFK